MYGFSLLTFKIMLFILILTAPGTTFAFIEMFRIILRHIIELCSHGVIIISITVTITRSLSVVIHIVKITMFSRIG